MEVCKLYWWNNNCKDGQYSSAKVHSLLQVKPKQDVAFPKTVADYDISLGKLEGLECEEIDGI